MQSAKYRSPEFVVFLSDFLVLYLGLCCLVGWISVESVDVVGELIWSVAAKSILNV